MFIACKCLNVLIGEIELSEAAVLCISPEAQRDPFFREKEKLGFVLSNNVSPSVVKCTDPSFLDVRNVGDWLIHQCLVCRSVTHASCASPPHDIVVNVDFTTTKDEIERLRKSENYSPVFNILVDKAPSEESKKPTFNAAHPAAGNLNKKLGRALQKEVDAVEEAVRLFADKKYAEFEEFRERAHRDHKILSCIFSGSDNNTSSSNNGSVMDNNSISLTNSINRNTIPLRRDNSGSGGNNMISNSSSGSSQLSTNKMMIEKNTAMPMTTNTPAAAYSRPPLRNNNAPAKNPVSFDSYKEDSLDSEGIFDLEGTDPPHNGLNSDVYDSDSDDSVSRDEGIHISRNTTTQPWNSALAKSLPMNVPEFTYCHDMPHENLDGDDIAASIKALARSVHGDVFGDLPRPRFSTQI